MPVKKEVCRNFQRGSCQYGQRCKFLHVTSQQQNPQNILSYQQQKPNPYGFGVQNNPQPKGASDFGSKPNQFKPFQNSWTRSSAHTAATASENQSQTTNHKCTDPESCRRIAVEDFEHERPLWRLTCYGHWKNAPCDIVGDISYEELRTAAYDDAKRGLGLQSIVDRERNLVNSKLIEFENLCKSHAFPPNSTPANQTTFPGPGPNAFSQNAPGGATFRGPGPNAFSQNAPGGATFPGPGPNAFSQNAPGGATFPGPGPNAFSQTAPGGATFPGPGPNSFSPNAQGSGPNSVSSFGQLGTSLNMGFGSRPLSPLNNAFAQPNSFGVSSQNSGPFGTKNLSSESQGNPFTSTTPSGFSNNSYIRAQGNPATTSAVSNQILGATNNPSPAPFMGLNSSPNAHGPPTTELQQAQGEETSRVDASVWSRNKWSPGEIPEEAPPDAFCY